MDREILSIAKAHGACGRRSLSPDVCYLQYELICQKWMGFTPHGVDMALSLWFERKMQNHG